jgi:MFS family permease
MSTAPVSKQRSIGPILLAPGVLPSQVAVFVLVVVSALCVVTFLPMMQAFVFTELLKVPKAEHGRLTGNLVTTQQLAVLFFVGVAGSLADRIGRKKVLVMAILGYVGCMVAYPLASGVAMLFVVQFIFGLMTTGHIAGSATMIADYPDNASRGKFVAAMLLIQAAVSALLVGFVGARLPSWLVAGGANQADAGRWAFWAVAGVAGLAVMVAVLFLRDPPRMGAKAPQARTLGEGLRTFWSNLRLVVAHGRQNPRFGLVMTMGLVIRSDYFVMLSFVSLWVVNAATGTGVTSADALKHAGLLMLTFKLSTAAAQAVFGFVADRIDRSRLLVASLLLTGLALISTLLVHDVFSLTMFIVVGVIGITESALIVCGQSMLGQEAPPDLRGSAMGIFYFGGTLGVVVMSFVAGFVFDKIGHAAPFVMVGLLNLVFAALGLMLLMRRVPEAAPAAPATAQPANAAEALRRAG